MGSPDDEVKRMMGNPRRAILGMSVPLIIAELVAYLQNFIDTVWCSGLGSDAISAVTLSGPLYWTITDIGLGLGIGVSTSVARAIGSGSRERADSLASQAIALTLILALVSMAVLVLICDPVLYFMSGGEDISLCREYVMPYFLCAVPIVLHGTVIGLLRSEGASRKVLILSVVSTVLNIVIDPLLIYGLGLGLTGAAAATCISFIASVSIGLYWYSRRSMYLRPSFKGFMIKPSEMKDIMHVGIPSMFQLVALSLLMIPQNMFVYRTGGDAGVVLAMTPYKFILLAIMPAQGLAQAMVPVTSALQGAGRYPDARDGFWYTVKVTSVICILLSVFLILAADPLMYLFTYKGDMAQYHGELVRVLRMYGFITLFAGVSETFSSILQSLRMAIWATVTITVREIVFIMTYWYASSISMEAIYHSMVTCMFFGMVLMDMFAVYGIGEMDTSGKQDLSFQKK